ncbi:MAG: undecaprenyl/decaprenyl-phosphate alpha-N-acetylglucosaminyl 1-phosphate transferase [Candidatus Omnitrophica bacterium]|nr:undecaprenyl/decaprenyl-phosphate alpha-N-acetylglucosaminyl 1-phosphate transferase [Candidatus Omnitrophota bacterium]
MTYFLVFAIACGITFLITPTIRYVGLKFSVIDKKNTRKIHTKIVTRFGGLGIYIGFIFALLTLFTVRFGFGNLEFTSLWAIVMASTMILILGMYDDARGADAKVKFFVQILAAVLLINSGFLVKVISIPWGGALHLGIFSIPVTILWLVGVTNAINLIDGLDGLAAGIVFICSLGLFCKFLMFGAFLPAFFAVALAGACLGFLKYNFFPAKIFMGDTGSMFLGFSIAALAIWTGYKTTTAIILLVPIIALGIPILDTFLALVRRITRKQSPFHADKEHLHHILLKKKFTEKQVVYIFWAITLFLNIIACSFIVFG